MDDLRIPPEADLLREAHRRKVPRRSIRELAGAVGLSEGRVRQILSGYQSFGRGQKAAVSAPVDTLVRLALALGVTPDQLSEVGRADAAEAMTTFVQTATSVLEGLDAVDALRKWLAAGDLSSEPPGRSLWLFSDQQLLDEIGDRLEDRSSRQAARMSEDAATAIPELAEEDLSPDSDIAVDGAAGSKHVDVFPASGSRLEAFNVEVGDPVRGAARPAPGPSRP